MHFIRKFLLFIIVPIFTLLLFATASTTSVVRVVGTPDSIKTILAESGIYSSVVQGLLDQSKAVSNNGDDISLNNELVKTAAL